MTLFNQIIMEHHHIMSISRSTVNGSLSVAMLFAMFSWLQGNRYMMWYNGNIVETWDIKPTKTFWDWVGFSGTILGWTFAGWTWKIAIFGWIVAIHPDLSSCLMTRNGNDCYSSLLNMAQSKFRWFTYFHSMVMFQFVISTFTRGYMEFTMEFIIYFPYISHQKDESTSSRVLFKPAR